MLEFQQLPSPRLKNPDARSNETSSWGPLKLNREGFTQVGGSARTEPVGRWQYISQNEFSSERIELKPGFPAAHGALLHSGSCVGKVLLSLPRLQSRVLTLLLAEYTPEPDTRTVQNFAPITSFSFCRVNHSRR